MNCGACSILVLLVAALVTETDALFCYTCVAPANENTRCNENQPMKCGPQQYKSQGSVYSLPQGKSSLRQAGGNRDVDERAKSSRKRHKKGMCGTSSSRDRLMKGCIEKCAEDRGDDADGAECFQCGGDLCNEPHYGTKRDAVALPRMLSFPMSTSHLVFHLLIQPTTYWEARLECVKRNQSLASIRSADVQGFLEDNLASIPFPQTDNSELVNGLWLGMTSLHGNVWTWDDNGGSIPLRNNPDCETGTQKYQSWRSDHPIPLLSRNQAGGLELTPAGGWISATCGEKMAGFLCASQSDDGESDVIQSMVLNSRIYTFHTKLANHSEARQTCRTENGNLANLSALSVRKNVTRRLNYVIKSSSFWRDELCESDPPEAKSPTTFSRFSCSTLLPFMCERAFEETDCLPTPETIDVPPTTMLTTQQPSITQERTPSGSRDFINEPTPLTTVSSATKSFSERDEVDFEDLNVVHCAQETITHFNVTMTFRMTSYRTFASSEEVCSSGRPIGSIFCDWIDGFVQYDVTTIAVVSCSQSIDDVLTKVLAAPQSFAPAELASIASDLRLMTSQPSALSHDDIINAMNYLEHLEAVSAASRGADDNLVTSHVATDVISTISSLQSAIATSQQEEGYNTNSLSSIVETFLKRVELNQSRPSYRLKTQHLKVKAIRFPSSHQIIDDITFTSSSHGERSYVTIDRSMVKEARDRKQHRNSSVRAVFVGYDSSALYPAEAGIVSQVISATVSDENEAAISVPVIFGMQRSNDTVVNDCLKEECSFYDPVHQSWATDGCSSQKMQGYQGDDTVQCSCNHTTSFAVVVSYEGRDNVPLEVASQVGLIICVFCLLVTVILFVTLPELKRVRFSGVHSNLCVCLLLAYTIFLIGVDQTSSRPLCVAIAASIHYLLLAAWGWMAVESVTMFKMFVTSFDHNDVLECRKMALAVYTVSGLVVVMTIVGVVIDWETTNNDPHYYDCPQKDVWSGYISDDHCWITGLSLYVGFIAIVGIVLLLNVIIAFVVIRAITWGRKKVQSSIEESAGVQAIRAILVAFLMGVAWVFAIPVVISRDRNVTLAFAWIFAIVISFQGCFMFYFFCLRRRDVRKAWLYPILRTLCCHRYFGEDTSGGDSSHFHSNGHSTNQKRRVFSKTSTTELNERMS